MRQLVETGFLVATEVRQGVKGALEKPYKATGKSWDLSVDDTGEAGASAHAAMVDAFREELTDAGPERVIFLTRFANKLNEASYSELVARITQLVEEFALRQDPDGIRMAFLMGGHLREALPDGVASAIELGERAAPDP